MDKRLQLHDVLLTLVPNVYFQPPEGFKMDYPCIVYKRGFIERRLFANDKPYQNRVRYDVTVIDWDPDSPILEKVSSLPMCIFQRHYTADNLDHNIYNLYY